MRDSDRLALARERLCAVQLAMGTLGFAVGEVCNPDSDVWAGFQEAAGALADLEAALGQPVTPQGLYVE
jgi:hypothetical protein